MPLKQMMGVRRFLNHAFREKRELFDALKEGQSPKVLVITCSDSRVVPLLLMDSDPGDIFVIRNAGNIIPPSSVASGEAGSVEYAVEVLGVKEIIICGHSHCGAVKSLDAPALEGTLPAVASWLTHAKPTLTRLREKYPTMAADSPLRLERAITENILLQVEHLKTHPSVARKLASGDLTIYAWYYRFETGDVHIFDKERDVFIPFEEAVNQAFLGEYIQNKMRTIVKDEVMRFLATIVSPKTVEEYKELMYLFTQLQLKGIGMIWTFIQENIIKKLWAEFGGLCDTRGVADPRFIALVKQCLDVKPGDLKIFQKEIGESKGYLQFCRQTMLTFLAPPRVVLTPGCNTCIDSATNVGWALAQPTLNFQC